MKRSNKAILKREIVIPIPIWKTIFTLLLIVNVLFVSWAGNILTHQRPGEFVAGLTVYFLVVPLSAIDFILVLLYNLTQHPNGISKVISYSALIVVGLVLFVFGYLMMTFFLH